MVDKKFNSTKMVYSSNSNFIPILRYSSLVLLFLAISAQAGHKSTTTAISTSITSNLQDAIIYYGDPKVFVGEPFSITCIISISEPIQWYKDGELIKYKHTNIRHLLRDEHSFIETESAVEDVQLRPNYENREKQLLSFDIRKELILNCNVTNPPPQMEMNWYKNGTNVKHVQQLADRFQLHDNGQTFVISRTQESDAGNYSCNLENPSKFANFTVVANLVIKLAEDTSVVEGEKLTIHCQAFGTDPRFSWTVGDDNNQTFNSTGRVIIKPDVNGVANAYFIYESAVLEDRGNFTCIAENLATDFLGKREPKSAKTYVRVKGKLAALWPFIGICAEVFVLCAIILIYEKRRNKQELDDSDTDQSPEQKNDQHVKDSDVRQRK